MTWLLQIRYTDNSSRLWYLDTRKEALWVLKNEGDHVSYHTLFPVRDSYV